MTFLNSDLAELLERRKATIVSLWTLRMQKARGLGRRDVGFFLTDIIPAFIDDLAATLRSGQERAQVHTAPLPEGFSLVQLLEEYKILTRVLSEVAEEARPLSGAERDEITGFVMARMQAASAVTAQMHCAELKVQKERRDRLVATLSQDLLAPLGGAEMTVQFLAGAPDILRESGAHFLRKIESNLARARRTIKNLLDVQRLEEGGLYPIEINRWCLREVALEALAPLHALYPDNAILLADGDSFFGEWDAGALAHAIENLVSNAVRHGEPHGPIIVRVWSCATHVSLSVHNQGSPIPVAMQRHLVAPLSRPGASGAASASQEWGSGLALVRAIVEAQQGKVFVDSREGYGTTFTVNLPWRSRSAGVDDEVVERRRGQSP